MDFWVLAALTCLVELLPIRLPRQHAVDQVTVSSAFALAVLFLFGALPALLIWALASVVADVGARLAPTKVVFNAAQYALTMAAAAACLAAAGGEPPLALTLDTFGAIVAASLAFFAVNHVLAGAGVALLAQVRIRPFLRRDLGFLAWTSGFQLALAPLLLGARGPLSAIGALPVLAIYLGGREAAAAAHRAVHDTLTGLPNRLLLDQRLADAVARARRSRRTVWVMVLDLDQFKAINDTFGHPSGDELLRRVAQRMSATLREGDTLARLGGDEFAVLLADCESPAAARACAERLQAGLAAPIDLDGMAVQVGASVGLASGSAEISPDELLRRADAALYRAKRQRGQSVASAGPTVAGADRIALTRALADALEGDGIVAAFQPKVGLDPGLAPAAEALARWRHPALGNVDPAAFVALAEHSGMITRLTARMLDLALAQCAASRRRGVPLRVAVNLAPRSLVDRALPGVVAGALERHAVPGDALQLEITESACVADLPGSPVLDELCALGVTFAIDDFGTGFSSLAQLAQLPVEEIKIDCSFVLRMAEDPQAEVIVRSIVSLAHSLDLRVTAEGVETPEALERLRTFGCHYAQGFLFGQPSPHAQLPALPAGPVEPVAMAG